MTSTEQSGIKELETGQITKKAVGGPLYKSIVPEIQTAYKRVEKHFMQSVVPLLTFIVLAFPSLVLNAFTNGQAAKIFLIIAIAGSIGFVLSFIVTARYGLRMMRLLMLKNLIKEIQTQESQSLDSLSINNEAAIWSISRPALVNIINRLIETDNLDGYKVDVEAGKVIKEAK